MQKLSILFTCEHASNAIPLAYQKLFLGKKDLLSTHRGFDAGTSYLGKSLGKKFKAPVVYGKFSRLLIDLNRSPFHKDVFSEMTSSLSLDGQQVLREKYHRPHWDAVQDIIAKEIAAGRVVLHFGVHSFTPSLHGVVRTADIGLLYDPRRKREGEIAAKWKDSLLTHGQLRIRRNYPYLGKFDGLTTELRKIYPEKKYIGLEIEINQSLVQKDSSLKMVEELLIKTLKETLGNIKI